MAGVLLSIGCGLLAPASAAAQTTRWSVTGAGCVPTGQTAASPGTFNSAGDAKFPAGRLGEIILTCPIPSSLSSASRLGVTYRDTDGRGTGVQVRAVLRQKSLDSGSVSDIGLPFDSNDFEPAAQNVRRFAQIANVCNTNRPFVFDHTNFTYYIQVNMSKRRRDQDALVASVDLGPIPIC
ncbi:MAG TPA: hypothetical protein VLK25_06355 [Allosphingosinicella sp.]|nr:hypothetical protein [Allosphingosinicella sp.]